MIKTLCVALLLSTLTACGKEEAASAPVIRPVRYITLTDHAAEQRRTLPGATKAGQDARLSFRVSGQIRKLSVKVGDRVEANALIAELDPRDYKIQAQEIRASIAQASAQARSAKANYGRARKLYEASTASKADLDSARAARDSAVAQISASRQRLERANRQIEDTRLLAPRPGIISAVLVEENENASPTQPIVTLSSGGQPEVVVSVPSQMVGALKIGEVVRVELVDFPDTPFSGTISEIAQAADAMGATYPVTLILAASKEVQIRSGLAASVTFTLKRAAATRSFTLPTHAVAADHKGRFVYVVKPSGERLGLVARRVVEVGAFTAGGLEIKSGLSKGERVITAGVSQIVDGQTVRLPSPPAPTGSQP